ncbi:hypothetical protein [Corallococcus interemptor]|uniref:hypothetical protein n=1 Tax=Corallococcus interemptor TaxID=2316720 RepID=UPI0011C3FEE5|nr:hypothetical protein [Corallococcus interemptor]
MGLFLGAGASYEVGMPLVSELTSELRASITPDKLREINAHWRSNGAGYSDVVIEDLCRVLVLPNQHYESILGHLETQFRRNSPERDDYHGVYSWLVGVVYRMLYNRHVGNAKYVELHLGYLEGIARLAGGTEPLWVFSLNHDLVIECLAAAFGVPLSCGFTSGHVVLPRRDVNGVKIGELKAEFISAEQLRKGEMGFF